MAIYELELQSTPAQTFTTTINNVDMEITLKQCGTNNNPIMLFALQIGGEYVCPFVPCFANQGLLPYPYMVSQAGGNFIFDTENDEYPNWQNFTTSNKLYFVTLDELNG